MAQPKKEGLLSRVEIELLLQEFVEEYPLYRKLILQASDAGSLEFPPSISQRCHFELCRDEPTTTWTLTDDASRPVGRSITYKCAHCRRAILTVWVYDVVTRTRDSRNNRGETVKTPDAFALQKIGQWPPWSIAVPGPIEAALTTAGALDNYKKGLTCMSQSYGIGALGYFRRIVEDSISDLLNLVEEGATVDHDQPALDAVKNARTSRVAEERLKLVADTVPATLRPGGVNPLATLYAEYSRGLHAGSDEECLAIAMDLKDALEYFFGNIRHRLEDAKAYGDRIRKRGKPSPATMS